MQWCCLLVVFGVDISTCIQKHFTYFDLLFVCRFGMSEGFSNPVKRSMSLSITGVNIPTGDQDLPHFLRFTSPSGAVQRCELKIGVCV